MHENILPRIREGRVFLASSGELVNSPNAGWFRTCLQNPENSGVNLYVFRLIIFCTQRMALKLRVNPPELPTMNFEVVNARIGSAVAPIAKFGADISKVTLGGEGPLQPPITVPANSREDIELPPIIIPPGVTLGLSHEQSIIATQSVTVWWWEE